MAKNHPDAGTFDIPIQRAIFGRGCPSEFFEIASRQHGRPARISFFGQRPAFYWTAICGLVLWDKNQSVQGAIENDADRNSRTCLGARSARRDDSRRDLGRHRAKETAKMNVERAPCSESPCLAPKSIRNCLRTSGRSLIGSPA